MREHATFYSTHIDGIVLSVTKIMFLVVKANCVHGRVMEMVARKMNATDFGSEMPSKRGKTIVSV